MVKADMMPHCLEDIRQIAGQLQLFLQSENVLLMKYQLHYRINAFAVFHRLVAVKIHSRLTLKLLLSLQHKGNHRLHTQFTGINQPNRQILNAALCQNGVVIADSFQIYLFFKGNHRLHAGAHTVHIRQIQNRHHKLPFQINRIFAGADLLHNDLALTVQQIVRVHLVI